MWLYIVKRLLLSIPTILIIAIASFIILENAPGNPAEKIIEQQGGEENSIRHAQLETEKQFWIKKLGLNLPLFYFSLQSLSEPAWLDTIADHKQRETILKNIYTNESSVWKKYIPVIRFHSDNRFHRWLFGDKEKSAFSSDGILHGDFGISYTTRESVMKVISKKIKWSLFFSLSSVILAYIVSIPLGIYMAVKNKTIIDRSFSVIVFACYSLPSFVLGVLLLMLFSNPDVIDIFPASGVKPVQGFDASLSFIHKLRMTLPYIVLPMICYTYSSFAFLTKLVKSSVLENLKSDYSKTARAKGLSQMQVATRHAFRNSLLPLITVFANVFPAMLGGSVILETIFTIPGMGYETYLAAQNNNYPMLVAVFTLTGLLTITGYLFSDILYAFADPRISIKNKSI
jgi:ABC-type dipeptide/oligopeptide/nickel transport system permease component